MRSPTKLLTDSFSLVRENMFLFLGIILVPMLIAYVAGLFMPAQNTGVVSTSEWAIYIALMLVSTVVNILMGIALILAFASRSLTIMQAYRDSLPFFFRYIGLSILMSVILLVGFLLLVIPGIILSVWFAFATFILVLERASIIQSLKRSREYVRGRWWGVFGRLIVMSIIAFAFSFIFVAVSSLITNAALSELVVTLLSVVLVPILVGYMYLLYQDVKGSGAASALNQKSAFAPESAKQEG